MSVRIEVNVGDNVLRWLTERLARPEVFLEALGKGLAENVRRRIRQGRTPEGTPMAALSPLTVRVKRGQGVLRDTGALLKSITHRVTAPRAVEVGSNLPYARVHQEGATIRARRRFLLIPLHFQARQVAKGAGPERFGGDVRRAGLFLLKTGKGLFLARAVGRGKGRRLEFWYKLKPSVRIPARPFLPRDLSADDDRRALRRAFRVWLGEANE